jgi:hypothetical protein
MIEGKVGGEKGVPLPARSRYPIVAAAGRAAERRLWKYYVRACLRHLVHGLLHLLAVVRCQGLSFVSPSLGATFLHVRLRTGPYIDCRTSLLRAPSIDRRLHLILGLRLRAGAGSLLQAPSFDPKLHIRLETPCYYPCTLPKLRERLRVRCEKDETDLTRQLQKKLQFRGGDPRWGAEANV